MSNEVELFCDQLLSAALNGVGQGMGVVLVLATLFQFSPKLNAATRHALELLAMCVLIGLFGAQLWRSSWGEAIAGDRSKASLAGGGEAGSESALEMEVPSAENGDLASGRGSAPGDAAAELWQLTIPRYLGAVIVVLWFVIFGTRLLTLFVQFLWIGRLKVTGDGAPDVARELFSRLCVELKVSRAPQLRVSAKVGRPILVGFRQPAVLLPERFCESVSPERLEQVFRHELGHVVRRDDWANLFQRVTATIFFFHPGILWLSRRMVIDREIACDDHVLSGVADRRAYALSLAEFASRQEERDLVAAPAAWSRRSQLKQRIDMILNTKRNTSPYLARGKASVCALAAVLVAALGFVASPRFIFAAGAGGNAPAEVPPAPPVEPAPAVLPSPVAEVQPNVSVRAESDAVEAAPEAKLALPSAGIAAPIRAGVRAPLAIVSPSGATLYAAAADSPAADEEMPHRKSRPGEGNDLERRLDRLEKLVQDLVHQNAQNNKFQFEFRDKLNSNFNGDGVRRMAEKMAKDVEKARKDAGKAVEEMKRQGQLDWSNNPGAIESGDNLTLQRKALEEQRQALERQMRALERQIQKLERERDRAESYREKAEARRKDGKTFEEEPDDAPKP